MEFAFSVTTIGYAVSVVLLLGLGLFVFFNNPKERINQLFFGVAGASALFGISFIFGSSLTNETAAYAAWFFNLGDVFIAVFYAHFMLMVVDRDHAYRHFIRLTYALGSVIIILSLVFPTLFLPEVVPKLYYPYYLTPGPLYSLMVSFFMLIPIMPFYELAAAYFRGGRDRLKAEYFLIASIVGYAFGPLAFFLVYDIPVDPLYAMFYGIYTVPIAYGMISRQILDIRIVVKRAAVYAGIVAVVTGMLVALILLNNYIVSHVPGMQFWTVPLMAAFAGVFLARFYWVQAIEADQLKYEFITIATHKLRTPLTRINWLTEMLLSKPLPEDAKENVESIDAAAKDLIEITHVLFEAARSNDKEGAIMAQEFDLKKLVSETVQRFKDISEQRNMTITFDAPEEEYLVVADRAQLTSVLGVYMENSLIYGRKNGIVNVALTRKDPDIVFSVTDDGIGIDAQDQKYVFDRFFRTKQAKLADTEGLGLGLSLAKSIVRRHQGQVGVRSGGEGKGSTFWFSIPAK